MKTTLFFIVVLSGLLLVSCGGNFNHQKWKDRHTVRLELTLFCTPSNPAGAHVKDTCQANASVAGDQVKNIVVGVFEGDKVLTVRNLANPGIGGINELSFPLPDSTPRTPCTAVVVGNVLSAFAITALKSATTKTGFLAIQSSLHTPVGDDSIPGCLCLFGHVVDTDNGDSRTFTLSPGGTIKGLVVELSRMAFHKKN